MTTATPKIPLANRLNVLGVLPFFLVVLAFLLYPALSIFIRSFSDQHGKFTLDNIIEILNRPVIRQTYWLTIQASVITSLLGGFIGFCLAWAISLGKLPRWIRSGVLTFSGVASNFAGF